MKVRNEHAGVRAHMLLLSPRYDPDSQRLWQAAIGRGWKTQRLDYANQSRDGLAFVLNESSNLALYGGHIWGEQIAKQIGIKLLSPPANWLATLRRAFTQRAISTAMLGDVRQFERSSFPLFVKSRDWPQSCVSRVYHSKDDLPLADPETPVLISAPAYFAREFRAFVLDGKIAAFSPYSRGPAGDLDTEMAHDDIATSEVCRGWLADALIDASFSAGLPRAVVIDVGMLMNGDVAVVEANPAWCSGMYACDPERVLLDVIAAATEQHSRAASA